VWVPGLGANFRVEAYILVAGEGFESLVEVWQVIGFKGYLCYRLVRRCGFLAVFV